MDRRAWGTALVALVLIGALVVPNLSGRRVVGSAAPIPVPDPPRVGQCLLAPADGVRSALEFDQVTVSSAGMGPCGAQSFGEVVVVAGDVHSFPSTVSNRTAHPEALACQPAARRYVGWNVLDDPTNGQSADSYPGSGPTQGYGVGMGRMLGPWHPASTTTIALYGPNLWQYLAGQQWLACVMLPRDIPYAGSVRGGPAGSASGAFASCWNRGAFVPTEPIPCAQPHSGETFGVARWVAIDGMALDQSCADLVRSATGMSDPLRGGAITIALQVGAANGATSESGSVGQASCTISVVADRRLTESLTAIGDGPLPWA